MIGCYQVLFSRRSSAFSPTSTVTEYDSMLPWCAPNCAPTFWTELRGCLGHDCAGPELSGQRNGGDGDAS
jgi:hypothetical protein